eukprot:TRINITY_DN3373_c1_g1_i1.p3 TRINITY_DN3373_c1_g1~~TRINITY_DN3373_c1_g1_i1.p3  ORF type:complete len:116 (-),score=1.85 TRINITY_DN3373_c1_g1_i1:265-612(-)
MYAWAGAYTQYVTFYTHFLYNPTYQSCWSKYSATNTDLIDQQNIQKVQNFNKLIRNFMTFGTGLSRFKPYEQKLKVGQNLQAYSNLSKGRLKKLFQRNSEFLPPLQNRYKPGAQI